MLHASALTSAHYNVPLTRSGLCYSLAYVDKIHTYSSRKERERLAIGWTEKCVSSNLRPEVQKKLGLASARLLAKLFSKSVFDLEMKSIRSAKLEVWQKHDNQFVSAIVAMGKPHEYMYF